MKNHYRSMVISFMGVDGSGKSTLIKLLRKKLKNKFKKIRYIHLRPYIILLDKSTVQSNPHEFKFTWPMPINLVRVFYWLIIYKFFFYFFANKKNQIIFFDRYVYDLIIDPIRYKFNLPIQISRLFLKYFPEPDMYIFLNAPIKTLLKRKKELSIKELKRQIKSYRNILKHKKNVIFINSEKPKNKIIFYLLKKIRITYLKKDLN